MSKQNESPPSVNEPILGNIELNREELVKYYNLSRAEIRIMELLVRGYSLNETAEHLGVTYVTVRRHLKQIYNKTSTYTIGNLIRKIFLGPCTTILKDNTITRSIEFKPEHHRAGLSILSYFSEYVSNKYPDIPISISIEQKDASVTLNVETPTGDIDILEKSLNDYIDIVKGKAAIRDKIQDEIEIIKFENMLEIARAEINNQNRILELKNCQIEHLERQITNLEYRNNIQFSQLTDILDKYITSNANKDNSLFQFLHNLSEQQSGLVKTDLNDIVKIITENQNNLNSTLLQDKIKNIADQQPMLIEKIHRFLLSGAMQGVAGNYLYSALQAALAVLPR
ncbi:MAG: helix-turn-helix transcriptional regulator [Hyphomicrobiales bacterium]|nr:helix-turn-helix transcriptional regulator [Hyphomicrobiales bacterium]